MINGEFVTDPCSLAHHPECKPIRTAHNLVERTVYQFNRKLKSDPSYAGKTPKPLWCEQKSFVKEKAAEEPEIFEEMVAHHNKKGLKSRRTTLKRALRAHNDDFGIADKENIAEVCQLSAQ